MRIPDPDFYDKNHKNGKEDRNNRNDNMTNDKDTNKYKAEEIVNQYSEGADSYPQRDTFRSVVDSFTIGETYEEKDREKYKGEK